ncbi:MAG TPA: polymer-forming cytoskeletal protein [Acidobacteriota bacterium]|nr:polymer-forming cytoskeletal protein [Acidobacteriota bacterium]
MGGMTLMAWYDRNVGSKKGPDLESEKIPDVAKPVAGPVPPAAPEAKPVAKVEEPPPAVIAGLIGYLYKGSRVTGQLSFAGPARIDGSVDGEIQCQGTLTIGESAEVKAKISAQSVVVRGKVEGNVSAKEKIELIAPARLIGNIDCPRLSITEGVVIDGDCSMGVAKQKGGSAAAHSSVADLAVVAQGAKATS